MLVFAKQQLLEIEREVFLNESLRWEGRECLLGAAGWLR